MAGGIVEPGRSIGEMVSFIDFAPTFLEIAGIPVRQTGMAPITGKSLTDTFSGEQVDINDPARNRCPDRQGTP